MAGYGRHALFPVIGGRALFAVDKIAVHMTFDNDPSRVIGMRSAATAHHGFTDKGIAVLDNSHGIGIAEPHLPMAIQVIDHPFLTAVRVQIARGMRISAQG